MKKETLKKANELQKDIDNISRILEVAGHMWIRVISPENTELHYSVRFQEELAEWLREKQKEYQTEFDNL